ncbi:MAG TPA: glycerophosphodiester phosphodiesterase family protein [Pseudolabrys sp.]|nr:glycerophosphodiester phosphodiesterase family protein [Pseudolabrys sp.]
MEPLHWITERPFAHRGLHDASSGIIENTGSAFLRALTAGYGIETDLQISADGEAMVHHDDQLGRVTEGSGWLRELTSATLKTVRFRHGSDRMMTLGELCELVSGGVPLLLELKSHFDGDRRLVTRALEVLSGYSGAAALMSFDPSIVEHIRTLRPSFARGIVAERRYADAEWTRLSTREKRALSWMLHGFRTRPHFLAYSVKDLPSVAPFIARTILRLPLLTWTVRNESDRATAASWADQIIFEGWRP